MATRHKGRPRNSRLEAAARARAGKKKNFTTESSRPNWNDVTDSDRECTTWTGGVNHWASDLEEMDTDYITVTEDESDTESSAGMEEDLIGLDGDEVLDGLRQECRMLQELDELARPTTYGRILQTKTLTHWKKAEQNRAFGYTGNSARRKREVAQTQREKEEKNAVIRKRLVFKI